MNRISLREIARRAGVAPATVMKAIDDPAWKRGKPPFTATVAKELMEMIANRETVVGRPRGSGSPALEQLRKDKLEREIRRLDVLIAAELTALQKTRGELLDAAEVEAKWAEIGNTVRVAMENLTSQIVPLALTAGMPHGASDEFRSKVDGLIRGVLAHLAGHGAKETTAARVAPH